MSLNFHECNSEVSQDYIHRGQYPVVKKINEKHKLYISKWLRSKILASLFATIMLTSCIENATPGSAADTLVTTKTVNTNTAISLTSETKSTSLIINKYDWENQTNPGIKTQIEKMQDTSVTAESRVQILNCIVVVTLIPNSNNPDLASAQCYDGEEKFNDSKTSLSRTLSGSGTIIKNQSKYVVVTTEHIYSDDLTKRFDNPSVCVSPSVGDTAAAVENLKKLYPNRKQCLLNVIKILPLSTTELANQGVEQFNLPGFSLLLRDFFALPDQGSQDSNDKIVYANVPLSYQSQIEKAVKNGVLQVPTIPDPLDIKKTLEHSLCSYNHDDQNHIVFLSKEKQSSTSYNQGAMRIELNNFKQLIIILEPDAWGVFAKYYNNQEIESSKSAVVPGSSGGSIICVVYTSSDSGYNTLNVSSFIIGIIQLTDKASLTSDGSYFVSPGAHGIAAVITKSLSSYFLNWIKS